MNRWCETEVLVPRFILQSGFQSIFPRRKMENYGPSSITDHLGTKEISGTYQPKLSFMRRKNDYLQVFKALFLRRTAKHICLILLSYCFHIRIIIIALLKQKGKRA
jgi:hypothetical protein